MFTEWSGKLSINPISTSKAAYHSGLEVWETMLPVE